MGPPNLSVSVCCDQEITGHPNLFSVHEQVEHPEVGRRFEGLPEGARRYVLNAYMRHKYPGVSGSSSPTVV